MQYSIGEIKGELLSHVYDVYEIIKEYFGEDKVDLQNIPGDVEIAESLGVGDISESGYENIFEISENQMALLKTYWAEHHPFILVYWPEVTITNENNRSIDIQDLYAKITVTMDGRIPREVVGFQLIRTTFPEKQYSDGYMHSHTPQFSNMPRYSDPCLGTGPIKNTIMDLKNNYDELRWMLFCRELSLYVTVESLSGVPYMRMENVGKRTNRRLYGYDGYTDCDASKLRPYHEHTDRGRFFEGLKQFSKYYLLHGHLQLDFDGSVFKSGMPYFDFMIDISNSFIAWYNKHGDRTQINTLYEKHILMPTYAADGRFYHCNNASVVNASFENSYILDFKGESKRLHIIADGSTTECTLVLSQEIAMYILNGILNILNYRFNDEYNNHRNREAGLPGNDSQEASSKTYKTALYV